jgi:hypothetical protein
VNVRTLPGLDFDLGDAADTAKETPETLRAEFEARREAQLLRLDARERRNRRNGALAGGFAGLLAVMATCGVTRKELAWHSFVWEALLCVVAGYLLARWKGGVLKGIGLFSAAYLLATLLRAMGLDPSVVFEAGDMRRIGSVTGNLTSLAVLAGVGGVLGHVIGDD